MKTLRSWRALLVREYLEHRIAFQWVPLGILALLTIAALSALGLHRIRIFDDLPFIVAPKIFEMGYLILLCLWLAYLAVTLFFFFGDAFSADRRNNAMLFWKSMPVSDLKILVSKVISGLLLFPLIIFVFGMISGVIYYLVFNLAAFFMPALGFLSPVEALSSFVQISLYGVIFYGLAMLWYAPYFVWVGGLSTVFGRWSLPLAFVIPGVLGVIENVALYGNGPTGGYVLNYIGERWNFALSEADLTVMLLDTRTFNAPFHISRLVQQIDWPQMAIGLVFAAVLTWLASEYRRRRIA